MSRSKLSPEERVAYALTDALVEAHQFYLEDAVKTAKGQVEEMGAQQVLRKFHGNKDAYWALVRRMVEGAVPRMSQHGLQLRMLPGKLV